MSNTFAVSMIIVLIPLYTHSHYVHYRRVVYTSSASNTYVHYTWSLWIHCMPCDVWWMKQISSLPPSPHATLSIETSIIFPPPLLHHRCSTFDNKYTRIQLSQRWPKWRHLFTHLRLLQFSILSVVLTNNQFCCPTINIRISKGAKENN